MIDHFGEMGYDAEEGRRSAPQGVWHWHCCVALSGGCPCYIVVQEKLFKMEEEKQQEDEHSRLSNKKQLWMRHLRKITQGDITQDEVEEAQ
ncbi:hypothetical protein EJB05_44339, partial [Eragrostis curvula]